MLVELLEWGHKKWSIMCPIIDLILVTFGQNNGQCQLSCDF